MKNRLLENHPALQAYKELMEKAYDLGISFTVDGDRMVVQYRGKNYNVEDAEDSLYGITEFPPATEVKLTFEVNE